MESTLTIYSHAIATGNGESKVKLHACASCSEA